jgi:sulfate adenylyltransferase
MNQRRPVQRGAAIFFTGLPGAGKTSIANALNEHMQRRGDRTVTLLDGDVVRGVLTPELGFTREHRDLNVLRIAYVASEVTKHGGIAICAQIAPYAGTREKARDMVTRYGSFVEVYVATPLEVCEARDPKGMYAKARAGLMKAFTGIDDPYEQPAHAEIVLDTRNSTPEGCAQTIVDWLIEAGILKKLESGLIQGHQPLGTR